jgi:hypothetical protein
MNLESRHFINGVEIRPKNADDIGLKMDWSGDTEEAELTTDSIVLENMAKKLVLDHIDQNGVFEGIPYTFMVGNFSLEYYIDLLENAEISGKGDSSLEVKIKRRKAIDWFRQQANGLSFESLNLSNPIGTIDVPYLIVKENQQELALYLIISTYTLTKALIEGIKQIVVSTTDFIKIISIGAVVNTGQIISASLLFAANVIYVIALLVALIDLTSQIIELIFPPIRKFKGVTILELMNKGCAKLGFNFQSSIIQNQPQLAIIGVPLKNEKTDILNKLFTLTTSYFNKGYPTAKDYSVSTLGKLMGSMQEVFNAKFRIVGNNLVFERRDYWVLNSGVNITQTLNLQSDRENRWGYNTADAWKRYYIHYQYDLSDWHTMNHLEGTDCEYSTEPASVVNADLVDIKGLVDISIPFAFGIRKNSLTYIEETALKFAKLADSTIGFFGGSSSLESNIKGRVGVMMIGEPFFTQTKLIWQVGGKQPQNYISQINANAIYQKYHTINQVKQNFKRVYKETIPFSTNQFLMLLNNNYVQDQDGNSIEILTFAWVNESKTAEITYAVLSGEGFNTKTIQING